MQSNPEKPVHIDPSVRGEIHLRLHKARVNRHSAYSWLEISSELAQQGLCPIAQERRLSRKEVWEVFHLLESSATASLATGIVDIFANRLQ